MPSAKYICIKDAIIVEKCMYGHAPVTKTRKGKFNYHKKIPEKCWTEPQQISNNSSRHMHVDS